MRHIAGHIVCLLLVAASLGNETRWYRLDLADARAGWRKVVERAEGDRRIWTTDELLRISRGGVPVEIEARSTWTDRLDGTPVEATLMQKMGPQPVTAHWRFREGEIEITTLQGERTNTVVVPAPTEPWLTPQAAREFIAARGDAGADSIVYWTLAPEFGPRAMRTTLERLGTDTITWDGREIPVTRWGTSTHGIPFTGEILYSRDWRPVGSVMKLPFGELRDVLAGPGVQHMGEEASPELFFSLFVEPEGDLDNAHDTSRLVMELRTTDGEPVRVEAAGAQTIARRGDGSVTIVVDPSSPLGPSGGELDNGAFLESSSLIDASDAVIGDLVQRAVAHAGDDPLDRAEAMRNWVRVWINSKGLATAFASASETAVDRAGDCSEHGVLLAAMLRADGIPARVATGLVWMEGANAFGWHMWTQGLIDGVWVDLDATLPMAYSPGHVLIATSPLSDGWGQADLVQLLGLLGNLEIDVIEVDR